eukprot:TRINITY_DN970_c2_g2_i3.p1 TRINITY_DN970_c2_g2~~TRINITY_DN970_c2_g2_i3.p1  ORF type:complete len:550 (-),score=76.18 TRINITY_DN970_c2_g2_i3:1920-3569(-)
MLHLNYKFKIVTGSSCVTALCISSGFMYSGGDSFKVWAPKHHELRRSGNIKREAMNTTATTTTISTSTSSSPISGSSSTIATTSPILNFNQFMNSRSNFVGFVNSNEQDEILIDAEEDNIDDGQPEITISPSVREIDIDGTLLTLIPSLAFSLETAKILQKNQANVLTNTDKSYQEEIHLAKSIIALLKVGFQKINTNNNINNINQDSQSHTHKWSSSQDSLRIRFLSTLKNLCLISSKILREDEMLLNINSPAYVLGDLHGSYKDLDFFSRTIWNLGVDFSPCKLVFLGDFVDRGPHSVELVAYLLALKVMHPKQVFLIRGNHEFRSVNGNINQPNSFLNTCIAACSGNRTQGEVLWEMFNLVFEWMPIAATINKRVFCCHGGIPRITTTINAESIDILGSILSIRRPLKDADVTHDSTCLALDILWSDPAPSEMETSLLLLNTSSNGFGPNKLRGENILVFGTKALDAFFEKTKCTHLIRAHQPPNLGFHLAKGGRVITVFSSSHYCGKNNSAGVVFVNKNEVKVAITAHRPKPGEEKIKLIEKSDF